MDLAHQHPFPAWTATVTSEILDISIDSKKSNDAAHEDDVESSENRNGFTKHSLEGQK
jgi:hypothetical protein